MSRLINVLSDTAKRLSLNSLTEMLEAVKPLYKPVNSFKKAILDNPDTTVEFPSGEVYAVKRIGNKKRYYTDHNGDLKFTVGGNTWVRIN